MKLQKTIKKIGTIRRAPQGARGLKSVIKEIGDRAAKVAPRKGRVG